MNELLFAVPWWIPTLLAIIGIALFVNGNKTQVLKIRNMGAALAGLAVLWALLSYFVDTDKETVEKETRALVQSVVDGAVNGDWKPFQSKLTPAVSFSMGDFSTDGDVKVMAEARGGAEWVKLKSAQVRDLTADQKGTYITVQCDIFTTQEFAAPLETSSWQFDWEKTNEGWKVQKIRLLRIKDIPADQLDSMVGHRLSK